MTLMIVGLAIFFVMHMLPTQRELRDGLVARFGQPAYTGLFSVLSLVGFVLIVIGYGELQESAGKNPQIWVPPTWMSHVTLLLMLPAMILLVAAYVPSRIKSAVRHPMLAAVKIWAFAHLLANGDLASMILFTSFLAYAVVDRISVKRRDAAGGGFGGAAGGGIGGDVAVVVVGTGLYLALLFFAHEWLIGVAPLPGLAS